MVQAYARRWQIEMALRFNKWELCVESPRLWMCVDVGTAPETAAFSYAVLCVCVGLAAGRMARMAGGGAAPLLSPHGKAEPGNPDSALSPARGPLSPVSRASPRAVLLLLAKFGMTHGSFLLDETVVAWSEAIFCPVSGPANAGA